jgi:hypothetical protein
MLLRLFRGTGPGTLFVIIVVLVAVWTAALIHPSQDLASGYEVNPMPLYSVLKHLLGNNALAGTGFSFAIMALMAVLLNNFNTSAVFISERTFLPGLFYILLTGLFPQYQVLNPVLPASLFLLIAVRRIVASYHKPGVAYNFFDAGLLISTGSLFYADLIWLSLIIIIGISLIRSFNFMEITISFLGLLTPWFLAFGIFYVTGGNPLSLLETIKINLFGDAGVFQVSAVALIIFILVGLMLIVSIAHLLSLLNTKKIKARATFSLFLWLFVLAGVTFAVLPSVSEEIIMVIGIPASYFLAHYFVFNTKKLIPEIAFSVLLAFLAFVQVVNLTGAFT